ncbi:MAG: DNA gyrase subunit A [Archaeoglobaceae archaeon]
MELIRDISDELKSSYIDYAMSVIVGRAIPDARDGLKPVQRRILYAMFEMGLFSNRPHRKSARIVGEVLGKYHPHGDAAVYDALVRMAQDFTMRYPLIDGQGNFGSIDGDAPAAMRYTEARLTKIAEEMLADIDKDVVDFLPNFDATLKEPVVLPAKIPNLLINGSSGIAVGMATNIPPHNLSEVCDAIAYYVRNPDCSVEELMKFVRGPDFPTGGVIVGVEGIKEAYETGRGKITVRGRVEIEGKNVVIREVPYMVNKARLVEQIAELAREKIEEIKAVRDESDREGIRVVIELRDASDAEIVIKKLYAYSNLQTTFGIINLALVDNEPRILNLKEMIATFVEHRREVIKRRTRFELENARKRLHVVEGLKRIVEDLDNAVQLIRSCKTPEEARKALIDRYSLSEEQANAVLQMRLQRLTAIEIDALLKEYEELRKKIFELESILADAKKVDAILLRELEEIKEKYGDERRTQILEEAEEISESDLVSEELCIVAVSDDGFAKRVPLDEFRLQLRGGLGLNFGMSVAAATVCSTLDKLLIFTNSGKVFWVNASEIQRAERSARGAPLKKFIRLENGDRVVSVLGFRSFEGSVVMVSPDGYVKRVRVEEFENAKRAGIRASSAEIADVKLVRGGELLIATRKGQVVRTSVDEVPEYGRTARGVVGVKLKNGDEVVSLACGDGEHVITVTANGYGKRTPLEEFRKVSRGATGVIGHRITEKTGELVAVEFEGEELIAFTPDGYCIRVATKGLPVQGRNSSGVALAKRGIKKVLVI